MMMTKIIFKNIITILFLIVLAPGNYAQDNSRSPNNDSPLFNAGKYKLFAGTKKNDLKNLINENSQLVPDYYSLRNEHKINSLTAKIELASGNTKPGLISGIYIGFGLPLSPLKGNTTAISLKNSSTLVTNYYVKYGITGGLTEKLPIGKKGNIRLLMDLSYSYFFQSGNDSSGLYTVKPKIQMFSIGFGGEYAFSSIGDFEPFLDAEATGNILGGSTQFLNNATGIDTVDDLNMVTRFGVTFGAGLSYKINKDISFVLGAKYNISNLIGKSWDINGARELNDAAYTLNGNSIGAKTISYMTFYLGLSVSLGSSLREIPW